MQQENQPHRGDYGQGEPAEDLRESAMLVESVDEDGLFPGTRKMRHDFPVSWF